MMAAIRKLSEILVPGVCLYRLGHPVVSFIMMFIFLTCGRGLLNYYFFDRTTLVAFTGSTDSTPHLFMGLIPRVEETYLVFNPTEKGFDIRRATPIWPDNRFLPYPAFPLMVGLYHGLAVFLLAAHIFLLWRWRKAP